MINRRSFSPSFWPSHRGSSEDPLLTRFSGRWEGEGTVLALPSKGAVDLGVDAGSTVSSAEFRESDGAPRSGSKDIPITAPLAVVATAELVRQQWSDAADREATRWRCNCREVGHTRDGSGGDDVPSDA